MRVGYKPSLGSETDQTDCSHKPLGCGGGWVVDGNSNMVLSPALLGFGVHVTFQLSALLSAMSALAECASNMFTCFADFPNMLFSFLEFSIF